MKFHGELSPLKGHYIHMPTLLLILSFENFVIVIQLYIIFFRKIAFSEIGFLSPLFCNEEYYSYLLFEHYVDLRLV